MTSAIDILEAKVAIDLTSLRPDYAETDKITIVNHSCPKCGRTFATVQAMNLHRYRAHIPARRKITAETRRRMSLAMKRIWAKKKIADSASKKRR